MGNNNFQMPQSLQELLGGAAEELPSAGRPEARFRGV
jgi:hypothetical protein